MCGGSRIDFLLINWSFRELKNHFQLKIVKFKAITRGITAGVWGSRIDFLLINWSCRGLKNHFQLKIVEFKAITRGIAAGLGGVQN